MYWMLGTPNQWSGVLKELYQEESPIRYCQPDISYYIFHINWNNKNLIIWEN